MSEKITLKELVEHNIALKDLGMISDKNQIMYYKYLSTMEQFKNQLPHGSGIDGQYEYYMISPEKIVIYCSYHSMDENGFYDGWIDYRIIIKPSFIYDVDFTIIGNFGKEQYIKDYLYDVYSDHFGSITR